MLKENSIKVLEKRYLKKNEEGAVVETPQQLFERVGIAVAAAGKAFNEKKIADTALTFTRMMSSLEFLPNSPTLMNAGRELGQLSACFVLPIEDTMDSIFETLGNTAKIHKSGGGTGFSFSRLRPANDLVKSTSGVSSGPISFMEVYDASTEKIKQGGTRRGANMGILRVDHPDIMQFITIKRDTSRLTNFNLSVALTAEFMEAVLRGLSYSLVNPRNGSKVKEMDARTVFNTIVREAWATGEPGVVFIDEMNRWNPTPHVGEFEATNPCGEQPLLPYESCNLGSINLSRMFDASGVIDWAKLELTTRNAVCFLDNVIEANNYPLEKIAKVTKSNRKIGLGVMGWADMLFEMRIPYGSEESIELAEHIMMRIDEAAKKMSEELATKRGAYPNCQASTPIRNATRTTIAPTGSISIIAGCSSGVEPIFGLVFERNIMDGTKMLEVNPVFEKALKDAGLDGEAIFKRLAKGESLQKMTEVPEEIRWVFLTAHDVPPDQHLKMQAAFQKHTNNAVSKTINLPANATEADVAKIYTDAYKLGLKGVTVYRDGAREGQAMSTGASNGNGNGKDDLDLSDPDRHIEIKDAPTPLVDSIKWPERTNEVEINSVTYRVKDQHGRNRFALVIGHIENGNGTRDPHEVWAPMSESERGLQAIAKLLSKPMRSDKSYLDRLLNSLQKLHGEDPFELVLPDGQSTRVKGNVEAMARLVRYRCEKLGAFENIEATPVTDALMCMKEPKSGPDGTRGVLIDISNAQTGDDCVLVVKKVAANGRKRPVSFWLTGGYPSAYDGVMVALSKAAQVSDPSWIGATLRQLLDFPEAGGDFRAKVPGAKDGRTAIYPSTLAYMAALILHQYVLHGLLTDDGYAVGAKGEKEASQVKYTGRVCGECKRPTVVRYDGCDLCTACGAVGSCG